MNPTDEEIALFAKLHARTGAKFFTDMNAMLELAEKLEVSGCVHIAIHHNHRGRVGNVKLAPDWSRQAEGRKSA